MIDRTLGGYNLHTLQLLTPIEVLECVLTMIFGVVRGVASCAPSSPPPAAPSVDVADGAAASPAHPGHADQAFVGSEVGGFHLAAVVERRTRFEV